MAKMIRAWWGVLLLFLGIVPRSMERCGIVTGYAGERFNDMNGTLAPVLLEDINIRDGWNARKSIPAEDVRGLQYSMGDVGQLNVISVKRRKDGKFDLIAGEKRLLAAQMAKKRSIDARIFEADLTPELELRIMLDENLVRKPLNVIEEAEAYSRLIEFMTVDRVASLYRQERDYVHGRLELLELPRDVQRMMVREHNPLRIHQAQILADLKNPSDQIQMARKVAPSVATCNLPEREVRAMVREKNGERALPLETPPAAPRNSASPPRTAPASQASQGNETDRAPVTTAPQAPQDAPTTEPVTNEAQDAPEATTATAAADPDKWTVELRGDVEVDAGAVYVKNAEMRFVILGEVITTRQCKLFLDLGSDSLQEVIATLEEARA